MMRKKIKNQMEKHDYQNILKNLKADNEKNKKKYKSLNKKKILLIISEIVVGSSSAIGSSTMSFLSPGVRVVLSSSTALLTSIAILITNEYISKQKTGIRN